MRRRRLLASAATAGVGAVAGCTGLLGGGSPVLDPVTVRTIDAPGSTAGQLRLPTGHVTVLDLFSTGCAPCRAEMPELRNARDRLDSVQFVSVTDQVFGGTFSPADVRQWWQDNDGAWLVGVDTKDSLFRQLSVRGVPTLAVLDPDGHVVWNHAGLISADAIVKAATRATR